MLWSADGCGNGWLVVGVGLVARGVETDELDDALVPVPHPATASAARMRLTASATLLRGRMTSPLLSDYNM